MATTLNIITNPDRTLTYALLVEFTVDSRNAEHLQDTQMIRDEAASWLESLLDATVEGVSVRLAD